MEFDLPQLWRIQMSDIQADWLYINTDVEADLLKILKCKSPKADLRMYAIGKINKALWPGQRRSYHEGQQERVEQALKIDDRLRKLADELHGSPTNAFNVRSVLLSYYRDCWRRLAQMEKKYYKEKENQQKQLELQEEEANKPLQASLF